MALKTFWTPYLVYEDTKSAFCALACYTIAASIMIMTMTMYMIIGGVSSQIYFPFFETDVRSTMIFWGSWTMLYFVSMIFASGLLLYGVKTELRGLMLPWLIGMMFCIIFQLLWSIWLLYAYYIYIEIIIPAIIYWLSAGYNFYCWLFVYGEYRRIYKMQSPNIELIYG